MFPTSQCYRCNCLLIWRHAGYMLNQSVVAAASETPGYQMYNGQDAAYEYDRPCEGNYVPSTSFCTKTGTVEACFDACLSALAFVSLIQPCEHSAARASHRLPGSWQPEP